MVMPFFMEKKLRYQQIIKWTANILTLLDHNYGRWERKNHWLRKTGMEIGRNVAIDHGFE